MATAGGSPAAMSEANGVAPSASPKTNTSSTAVPSAPCRAASRNRGIVSRKRAPESRSWRFTSPAVYSGFIVVTTPPAVDTPKKATAYSGTFGL